jgi:hypothetical protein
MLKEEIQDVIRGLLLPSESDERFEYVEEKELPKGEQQSFAEFINSLIVIQEWDGPNEMAQKCKFKELRELLERETTTQIVVHAGEYYYLVGYVNGRWYGAKAKSVET